MSPRPVVALLGAGTPSGRAACASLADRGARVRAVRADPGRQAGLLRAFRGCGAAVALLDDHPRHLARVAAIVEAARAAGVARLVLGSALGADRGCASPSLARLGAAEALARGRGPALCVVRSAPTYQGLRPALERALGDGWLRLPLGRARVAFVDAADVGEVAAQAALRTRGGEAAEDLTGPEALDLVELAGALSRAGGRPVRAWAPASAPGSSGGGPWGAGSGGGAWGATTETVRKRLRRAPRCFEDWLRGWVVPEAERPG